MSYNIPLFDLNYDHEEEDAVLKTVRSKWLSMGANVKNLEAGFQQMLQVQHAVALTNCTAALHLALEVLGIGEGDEVLVPSLTFVATVNAVRYVGATPVFVDLVGPEDFSMDPDDLEAHVTPRTKAVLPMHFGGFGCDMNRILAIARQHGLRVVEDAAHAPHSEYDGRMLGTLGDIGVFSFFSNKNMTCGEGGMLVTSDDALAQSARLLRSHGMTTLSYDRAQGHATRYDVVGLGYNYRLDDVRGALALAQLAKLEPGIAKRLCKRRVYLAALEGVKGIHIPYRGYPYAASHYIFPIVLAEGGAARRDAVRKRLAEAGIETSVHYPAVHRFSYYAPFTRPLPRTEFVADHEITLPLFEALTEDQIRFVAQTLGQALESEAMS
jgi:dTDP-4-amino-4,6-dideoxygalactose transaminase